MWTLSGSLISKYMVLQFYHKFSSAGKAWMDPKSSEAFSSLIFITMKTGILEMIFSENYSPEGLLQQYYVTG